MKNNDQKRRIIMPHTIIFFLCPISVARSLEILSRCLVRLLFSHMIKIYMLQNSLIKSCCITRNIKKKIFRKRNHISCHPVAKVSNYNILYLDGMILVINYTLCINVKTTFSWYKVAYCLYASILPYSVSLSLVDMSLRKMKSCREL